MLRKLSLILSSFSIPSALCVLIAAIPSSIWGAGHEYNSKLQGITDSAWSPERDKYPAQFSCKTEINLAYLQIYICVSAYLLRAC